VGEAVADALAHPADALRMADLRDPDRARRALRRLQTDKRADLAGVLAALEGIPSADPERRVLEDPSIVPRWLDAAAVVASRVAVVDDAWLGAALAGADAAVFEGAQGVLLDEWLGFHPHTTYSTCTFEGALELLRACGYRGETVRIGVLRTYLVRHGDGPLPTEDPALRALPELHNADGPWQGRVRRGWPDVLLACYAAAACGGLDAVALTHLDALGRVPAWQVCRAYRMAQPDPALFEAAGGDAGLAVGIRLPPGRDLDRQAALGVALAGASPVYEAAPWRGDPGGEERAIAFFEEALGAPVRLTACGPSARDVRVRGWDTAGAGSLL
jgi:adenylosuccinate synthase